MVLMSTYNYYLVISVAFIQFAILSSFIYQVFRESRKPIDKDADNARINKSSSVVNQLEYDTVSRGGRENTTDINELIMNINEDEVRSYPTY
ncbi:hypothetical protein [Vulcanisaeta distributa]|uniref:hypothetical protein n=1 Tax=Vulcanisaeta distributa TaxID=164451 RepID=UPI0006D2BD4A|nr:hypothetical protein [Vulcanisaeta distributa]